MKFKSLFSSLRLILLCLIVNQTGIAQADICERTHQSVLKSLQDRSSQLSFENGGGIANGGVCWWHSRFIRNAAYLAEFRPDLPKADELQAEQIAFDISHFQATVVPGFSNLREFSSTYPELIQRSLENWQKKDGILKQAWLKGLLGRTKMSPNSLRAQIEDIVGYFNQVKRAVFLKLQLEGIMAHAALLIGVAPRANGYDFILIDSNYPTELIVQSYEYGTTSLNLEYLNASFVPYIDQEKDIKKITKAFWFSCDKELI